MNEPLDCLTMFHQPVIEPVNGDRGLANAALANNSNYAFAAGIFTQNLARAHRLTKKVKAGVVWVNTYRAISPVAPFGGNGFTGYGRESGMDAIRDYTRTKTVWINTSDVPLADWLRGIV